MHDIKMIYKGDLPLCHLLLNRDQRSMYRPLAVRFSSVLYEWLRNKADKEEISFNQMVLQCCKYVMDEEERNAEIKETGDLHE